MPFSKRRLRWFLGLFFVALLIPSTVLTWQAYSRLKWESFHRYQVLADELLGRVDRRLREMVASEERRAFADYRFSITDGVGPDALRRRSPLADYPVRGDIPGLLGHFQVDAAGRFTTPLLPDATESPSSAYGISEDQLAERQAVRELMLQILSGQAGAMLAQFDSQAATTPGQAQPAASQVPRESNRRTTSPPAKAAGVPADAEALGRLEQYSAAPQSKQARRAQRPVDSGPAPAPAPTNENKLGQAAFDLLSEPAVRQRTAGKSQSSRNIGRVDELRLDRAFDDAAPVRQRRPLPEFRERVEYDAGARPARSSTAPATPADDAADGAGPTGSDSDAAALVSLFESEVDPFAFDLIGDTHFVLYRKVWREGRRFIQGAVIDRRRWLRDVVEDPFRATGLAGMSRLGIVFDDDILSALGDDAGRSYLSRSEDLSGTLLHRGRLSSPLDRLELIFTVTRMPAGPAGALIGWVAVTLGLLLLGGFLLMYRLGARQIELGQQQRDFVSAVSHELKTPLTSIRMYSEMLREGWADETRRRSYYDFIHDESERLSRLIANVLQLARMSRDELNVDARPTAVGPLLDLVRSKVSTQIAHAGFELEIESPDALRDRQLSVDADAFSQIMINLVDNAIKFSANAERRVIRLEVRSTHDGHVEFIVRDYGPGVPRDQLKKIFGLFYRSENELTRETVGTGIGLALVQRLTEAMQGHIDVVNRDPGAEFRLRLPTA